MAAYLIEPEVGTMNKIMLASQIEFLYAFQQFIQDDDQSNSSAKRGAEQIKGENDCVPINCLWNKLASAVGLCQVLIPQHIRCACAQVIQAQQVRLMTLTCRSHMYLVLVVTSIVCITLVSFPDRATLY